MLTYLNQTAPENKIKGEIICEISVKNESVVQYNNMFQIGCETGADFVVIEAEIKWKRGATLSVMFSEKNTNTVISDKSLNRQSHVPEPLCLTLLNICSLYLHIYSTDHA